MISILFLDFHDFLHPDPCFIYPDCKTFKLCRLIWHIKMLIGIIYYYILYKIRYLTCCRVKLATNKAARFKQSNGIPLYNLCLIDNFLSVTQFSKYHRHPWKNEFECHVLVKAFVHSNEHLNLKKFSTWRFWFFRLFSRQKISKKSKFWKTSPDKN